MLIRRTAAIIVWIPTVILWVLLVPFVKLLGAINKEGISWRWRKVFIFEDRYVD